MSVLLCLLLALVEVHSQTAPYLTFEGSFIPNHSYLHLKKNHNKNNTLKCHTDLNTCCSITDGPDRGDWLFPNGNRLPFSSAENMYQYQTSKQVHLIYVGNSGGTSGIYSCYIETNAVKKDGRETVYIGLYTSGGEYGQYIYNIISNYTYVYYVLEG